MRDEGRMKPHDKLRQAREDSGAAYFSVAEAAGVGANTYWDLEGFDDDLYMTVSLAEIGRIASVLGLSMEELFAADRPHITGRKLAGLEPLIQLVLDRVRVTGRPLSAFEDEVGWALADAVERPTAAWDQWNVDCFRDVCGALGIDWLSVMQGAFEQRHGSDTTGASQR
jgi:transcriptional regulator with XRE-family HTH domain